MSMFLYNLHYIIYYKQADNNIVKSLDNDKTTSITTASVTTGNKTEKHDTKNIPTDNPPANVFQKVVTTNSTSGSTTTDRKKDKKSVAGNDKNIPVTIAVKSPEPKELTDEEKFKRAQQNFAAQQSSHDNSMKSKTTQNVGNKAKNAFSGLLIEDDDDDEDD